MKGQGHASGTFRLTGRTDNVLNGLFLLFLLINLG